MKKMRIDKEKVQKTLEDFQEKKEITIHNDFTDYEIARKIITALVDLHEPISAKRAQKILDVAKSMVLDIANIYYED